MAHGVRFDGADFRQAGPGGRNRLLTDFPAPRLVALARGIQPDKGRHETDPTTHTRRGGPFTLPMAGMTLARIMPIFDRRDQPGFGTLIHIGSPPRPSGLWWMVIFPVVQLALLVIAVNLLGDWLRDTLNPRLR